MGMKDARKVPGSFLLRVGRWPRAPTRAKWGAWEGVASRRGGLPALAVEPGCRE